MSTGIAFLWADRVMVKRIRDEIPNPATAMAVYFSLCELASEHRASEFAAKENAICALCGLTSKTVRAKLVELESLKAISVIRTRVKAPSTFKLLNPLGTGSRMLGKPRSVMVPERSVKNEKWVPNPNINNNKEEDYSPPLTSTARIGAEKEVAKLDSLLSELEADRTSWNTPEWSAKKEQATTRRETLLKSLGRLA